MVFYRNCTNQNGTEREELFLAYAAEETKLNYNNVGNITTMFELQRINACLSCVKQ